MKMKMKRRRMTRRQKVLGRCPDCGTTFYSTYLPLNPFVVINRSEFEELRRRLKKAHKTLNISFREMEMKSGVSFSFISRVLSKAPKNMPTRHNAEKINTWLNSEGF